MKRGRVRWQRCACEGRAASCCRRFLSRTLQLSAVLLHIRRRRHECFHPGDRGGLAAGLPAHHRALRDRPLPGALRSCAGPACRAACTARLASPRLHQATRAPYHVMSLPACSQIPDAGFGNDGAAGVAVLAPAGTYRITRMLEITQSNVVLRGEGVGKTTLYFPQGLKAVYGAAEQAAAGWAVLACGPSRDAVTRGRAAGRCARCPPGSPLHQRPSVLLPAPPCCCRPHHAVGVCWRVPQVSVLPACAAARCSALLHGCRVPAGAPRPPPSWCDHSSRRSALPAASWAPRSTARTSSICWPE